MSNLFEAIMIICFGISWPISIVKALRTKVVEGKSALFMAVVSLGYASGIVHKVQTSLDWVTILYVMNLVLVLFDLALYYRYRRPCQA